MSIRVTGIQEMSNVVPGAKWGLEMRGDEHRNKAPGRAARPVGARSAMNEVVCGAMMLAYERGGKWSEVERPRLQRLAACS